MVAGQNLLLFAFLVLGAVGIVGTLRRLPIAYGAYAWPRWRCRSPIRSRRSRWHRCPATRWCCSRCSCGRRRWLERRRLTQPAFPSLAVLLGLFTAEFATWRFVACSGLSCSTHSGRCCALELPPRALRTSSRERFGVEVGETGARRRDRGRDRLLPRPPRRGPRPGARWLSCARRCAEVLRAGCPPPGDCPSVEPSRSTEALLASLQLQRVPDVRPALERACARGQRLVVVSNWDVSLDGGARARSGWRRCSTGSSPRRRSAPASRRRRSSSTRWRWPGRSPDEAVHVGDSLEEDVGGRRAAGIRPVLIRRDGGAGLAACARSRPGRAL